ncbi:Mbov_0400 family ICE element protein [Candidatus Mycoplasma pogonae]
MNLNDKKHIPFFTIDETVLSFNTLEDELGHHKILIIYNEYKKEFCYLTTRSARNKQGNLKKSYKGEILITKKDTYKTNKSFERDFYVDTTKIFTIKEQDLFPIVSENEFIYSEEINPYKVLNIHHSIDKNLKTIPPYIALMNVYKNNENSDFKSYTFYANEELLKLDYQDTLRKNKTDIEKQKIHQLADEILNERNVKNASLIKSFIKINNSELNDFIIENRDYFKAHDNSKKEAQEQQKEDDEEDLGQVM